MIRGDLSNRLIHLTRGPTLQAAAENFQSILSQGCLLGSNRDIRGGFNCVCFSEAPLGNLTQSLAAPTENGMRYSAFGVVVSKIWLFNQGGRPVIYQPNEEYIQLPDLLKYRHVRYEPHRGIDHTWEREWRIQTDRLSLCPDETTFVVPTRRWENEFHQQHISRVAAVSSIIEVPIPTRMPWHFVVLEDLGITGFDDYNF